MDPIRPRVGPALNDVAAQQPQMSATPRVASGSLAGAPAGSALGLTSALDGLRIDARSHLEQTLKLDPAAVRPRVLLFLLELGEQRFAMAEQIMGALVREFPQEPEYLALYAELGLRTADFGKAREFSSRALRIEPQHVEAQRVKLVLAVVTEEAASDEASSPQQRLATLVEQSPESARVLMALFQQLVTHHHLPEAIRLGQALQRAQPQDAAFDAALVDLRVFAHPMGMPLYQMRRLGWFGFVGLGLLSFAIYRLTAALSETLAALFLTWCLLMIAYVWLYPKLMRAWYRDSAG